MIYRAATNLDKNQILDFCQNTFEWGDYIHKVWDIWLEEKNGLLMVAEIDDEPCHIKKTVAMIHGILYDNTIWIEGIRVNPQYRNRGLASTLVKKVIQYGKERNAKRASAVVSVKNIPSLKLMFKLNFVAVDKWIYSSIKTINKKGIFFKNIRRAEIIDKKIIENFLSNTENFTSHNIRFVKAWRWYTLTDEQIYKAIVNGQLYIFIDERIRGMVMMDNDKYFYRGNYEIAYLCADSKDIVSNLLDYCRFLADSYNSDQNNNNFKVNGITNYDNTNDHNKRINVFCPDRDINLEIIRDLEINNLSKFIVYDKKL